ncbi:hypothetical protein HDV05_000180 [Chytridiales sp. JEL 0842]|nr:hypothetical protein HDV05_000180 [Chytridiales sp. JEL 0842]
MAGTTGDNASYMQRRSNEGSSRLGQYMLQGWVMMADTCPIPGCGMPLMRTRDHSSTKCVLCDDPKNEFPVRNPALDANSSGQSSAERNGLGGLVNDAPASSPSEEEKQLAEAAAARREQSDRASRLIGQKLLSGWTMLADACDAPECMGGVPLMKKDGVTVCVLCNKTVYSAPPAQTSSSSSTEAARPAQATAPTPATASRSGPTNMDIAPKDDEEPDWEEIMNSAPTKDNVSTITQAGSIVKPSSSTANAFTGTFTSHPSALAETASALEAHILSLKIALAKVRGFKESKEVCEAIAACANALAAVKSVGSA